MRPTLLSLGFMLGLSLLAVAAVPNTAIAQGGKTSKSASSADGEKAASADAPAEQSKVKVERGSGGRKVYKIEGAIVIEGKIQKPEAFYVLQKSNINYDWHELKQEFVPKILDSVTKAPF